MNYYMINDKSEGQNLIVPWWSITKTVMAVTVLRLCEAGILQLDRSYLGLEVTLEQLLRHESGLNDYGGHPAYKKSVESSEKAWPFDNILSQIADFSYPKGSFNYSNIGYGYIKRIIEESTQMAMIDVMKRYVFEPLHISDVRMLIQYEPILGLRMDYDPNWVYHGLLVGPMASGCHFLKAIMAGELLADKSMESFMTTHVLDFNLPGRPILQPAYALGMMVDLRDDDLLRYGHNGAGPDSFTILNYFPAYDTVIMVFSQTMSEAALEEEMLRKIRSS